jgi:hypothetical protein
MDLEDLKYIKGDNSINGKPLTERQKMAGSLKGKNKYWSEELRCWIYMRPGKDFKETERRLIEQHKLL